MDVLRSPDTCFDDLPDYGFAPHYREVRATDGTFPVSYTHLTLPTNREV